MEQTVPPIPPERTTDPIAGGPRLTAHTVAQDGETEDRLDLAENLSRTPAEMRRTDAVLLLTAVVLTAVVALAVWLTLR